MSSKWINTKLGYINLANIKNSIDREKCAVHEWMEYNSAYYEYKYFLTYPKGRKKAKYLLQLDSDIVMCV
jgi:hypothetical protein